MPWMSDAQARVYADAWAETGSADLALATFRQDPRYDQWFPGNRRDDGTTRLTEFDYVSTVEGYQRNTAAVLNVPANLLLNETRIRRLIESGTSADEFGAQLQEFRDEIVDGGAGQAFADLLGLDPDVGVAAMAGALFDEVAPDDLTRTPKELSDLIGAARISAEAETAGFGFLDRPLAERFQSFDLRPDQFGQVFGRARQTLPNLNRLLEVFDDPAQELSLEQFVEAATQRDPQQVETVNRLLARAQSQFSPGALFRPTRGQGIQALRR